MPKFIVSQHRDALVHYFAMIEADSKEEAHAKAEADECVWCEDTLTELDDREIPLDEIEEVKSE